MNDAIGTKPTKAFTLVEVVASTGLIAVLAAVFVFPSSKIAHKGRVQVTEASAYALNAAIAQYKILVSRGATPLVNWDTEAGALSNLSTGLLHRGQEITFIRSEDIQGPVSNNGLVYHVVDSSHPGHFELGAD